MLSATLITAATALAFIRGTTRHYRQVHEAYERAFGDSDARVFALAELAAGSNFYRAGEGRGTEPTAIGTLAQDHGSHSMNKAGL